MGKDSEMNFLQVKDAWSIERQSRPERISCEMCQPLICQFFAAKNLFVFILIDESLYWLGPEIYFQYHMPLWPAPLHNNKWCFQGVMQFDWCQARCSRPCRRSVCTISSMETYFKLDVDPHINNLHCINSTVFLIEHIMHYAIQSYLIMEKGYPIDCTRENLEFARSLMPDWTNGFLLISIRNRQK